MSESGGAVRGVVFDLDETLVPLSTRARWQWAWRPNGPAVPERHMLSSIRKSLHDWDRRRWRGLIGAEPASTESDYRGFLAGMLEGIADRPLPESERTAVLDRFLGPFGPLEPFPDVRPALEKLSAASIPYAVLAAFAAEPARTFLKRVGLPPDRLVAPPADGPTIPHKEAFRAATKFLSARPSEVVYVGDLYWSDVRAAARAGLSAVLIDREGRSTPASGTRLRSLAELPELLRSGTPPAPEPSDLGPGPSAGADPP